MIILDLKNKTEMNPKLSLRICNYNDCQLSEEKKMILEYAKEVKIEDSPAFYIFRKSNDLSEHYRKLANKLISNNLMESELQWALTYHDKSIIFAVDDSLQLAWCLLDRANFLFNLNKYDDCLKDCEVGINVSNCSDELKAEFQFLMMESRFNLRKGAKRECIKALALFNKLKLDRDTQNNLLETAKKYLKMLTNDDSLTTNNEKKIPRIKQTRLNFHAQTKIDCASKSITLKYDDVKGKSIVTATKDIEPGEIIAIEKSYLTLIRQNASDNVRHCFYCAKASWSLIPCKHCVYYIYCSEKCRLNDWQKVHQFECMVLPHTWYYTKSFYFSVTRFMLTSVDKAGGISQLREEVNDIQQWKDLSNNNIREFDCKRPKAAYSLSRYKNQALTWLDEMVQFSCKLVCYLATKTDFFGQLYDDVNISDIFENDDVVFIAAITVRSYLTMLGNGLPFIAYHSNIATMKCVGVSFYPFCRLFNHSCTPNANYFNTDTNQIIVYTKTPIKKGEQICISYTNSNFIDSPTHVRRRDIINQFLFECSCRACKNNWSWKNLKTLQMLFNDPKELHKVRQAYSSLFDKIVVLVKNKEYIPYNYIKDIIEVLKILHEKSSGSSCEYEILFKCLNKAYVTAFGNISSNLCYG